MRRREALQLESEHSPDAPDRRVLGLIKDYESDLVANVAGVCQPDAPRLGTGQAGDG